jgi:hypothetical protein
MHSVATESRRLYHLRPKRLTLTSKDNTVAIKKLPAFDQPGRSRTTTPGFSNVPPQGVQFGPHIGFGTGVTPRGPEIHARDITASDLKPANAGAPSGLNQLPGGKPAAVDAPRQGCVDPVTAPFAIAKFSGGSSSC